MQRSGVLAVLFVAETCGLAMANEGPIPPPDPRCDASVKPKFACPADTTPVLYCLPAHTAGLSHPYGDGQSSAAIRQECVLDATLGTRHGPVGEWRVNGKRSVAGTYKDDAAEGTWRYWYSSGRLAAKVVYKKGRTRGNFVLYHEGTSGAKAATGTCGAFDAVGTQVFYDTTGVVIGSEWYDAKGFIRRKKGRDPMIDTPSFPCGRQYFQP